MKCKECGARLDPVMELCPECGAAVEEKEKSTGTVGKIIKIAVSSILVLTLLFAMVGVIFKDELIPGYWFSTLSGSIRKDGNPDNVTSEGTYTASRFGLKRKNDTVVAKIGNATLTNGQLLVYYNMTVNTFVQSYYSSLSSLKLDTSLPLDRQTCGLDESLTWQQYFLKEALNQWRLYVYLCQSAEAAGVKLTETQQQELNNRYSQFYAEYVEKGVYASVEAMIQDIYGPSCTYADYLSYATTAKLASSYYEQLVKNQKGNVTEEAIEGFYQEQKAYFDSYGVKPGDGNIVVDVRHILITVKAATGQEEHVEESHWEATRVKAQDVLDEWLAGEATEESFAALVEWHSADEGSNLNGGLYTGVRKGDMTTEFDNWCFDESRQKGDYGLIRTDYGYHVMYFSGSEELWHSVCKANAPKWMVNKQLEEARDALDMEVRYHKIKLWERAYYSK